MDFFGRNTVKEKLIDFRRNGNTPENCRLILRHNNKNRYPIDIMDIAHELHIPFDYQSHGDFDAMYSRFSHQGVVLSYKANAGSKDGQSQPYPKVSESDMLTAVANKDRCIIVLLDGIKDVGNLGAILRSALLFNVDYVILPKDNSAAINETAVKRSAGAAFKLPTVTVTNIARCIDELKKAGCWIYAADMGGQSIDKTDFADKTALVMGAEGSGIRRLVRERSDVIVGIPTNDKLDSLNVSVSTGIILYEVNRQRLRKD